MEVPAGLCAICAWSRAVETNQGMTYRLCGRAARDPDYPKYPRLPVLRCEGFVEATAEPGSDQVE